MFGGPSFVILYPLLAFCSSYTNDSLAVLACLCHYPCTRPRFIVRVRPYTKYCSKLADVFTHFIHNSNLFYICYYGPMFSVSQEEFEKLVADAMDALPEKYQKHLNNVVIVVGDFPTQEQLNKQKIGPHQTLLGLYEGIPLTSRGNNYSGVLPDKITLFKIPIE